METSAKKGVHLTSLNSDFHTYIFSLLLKFNASVMQNFLKKMTVVSVFLKMNDEVKKQGGREVCKVVGVGSTRHTCSPKQLHLRVVMSTLVCSLCWKHYY